MNKYNDEQLSPSLFETMAKEYALKLKNNHSGIDELIQKIKMLENDLQTNITCLKNFNTNNINQKRLSIIIEKIGVKDKNNKSTNNYCQTLNTCIYDCCKICELILSLQSKSITKKLDGNYQKMLSDSLNIIPLLSQMYGECKYREI